MKPDKLQVASYGLHYHANNQLIPNATDRVLLQSLIDIVRNQLSKSLDDQSIIGPISRLARVSGLDAYRTIPGCLDRLEALGLIKKHKNAITVLCDEYVTLVQHYESLNVESKKQFAKEFMCKGVEVLQGCSIPVENMCRSALLGVTGSSIPVKTCKVADISSSEGEKPATLQIFEHSNSENLQPCIYATLQKNLFAMAKNLHGCRFYMDFEQFCELFEPATLQSKEYEFVKSAFFTGEVPNTFTFEIENICNLAGFICATLQVFCQKYMQPCSTVIIRDKIKDNKGTLKSESDEKEQKIEEGFANFGKVEVIDFNEYSEEIKEGSEEIDDISQQKLKRAERSMRAKNSYRNKPFIKVERVKEIVDCLDEVVKFPVDFFLYQFWWGVFDLYCEHYHPSSRIDEEGEVEDEPQPTDWKEMIGAALPQDEIYSLAQNIYADMTGAVEQGRYVYGDNNEWEVKFGFKTFQDFNPYEIFQWSPCTMQDKSVPALRVAIDKFYDIEANDVFTSSKGGKADKKVKNSQNKKLIGLILSADGSSLTPMESAIKSFYRDFVVSGEENVIDEFTDGKGTALESGGGLPDHLLKPWCYSLPSVGYNELTSVLNSKYKPCDGVHKKAYIFSAENVVEWNERNGYTNTIAHQSLQ